MQLTEQETSFKPLKEAFFNQQSFSAALRKEPITARKQRLQKLRAWLHANRLAIHEAMFADFQKNPMEVDSIEIFHVLAEIKDALANLDQWSARKKVDAPFTLIGTRSFIQYEPRGVCLILSPWNYPLSLCVGPLVSALSAGNAVVLKPSELTPNVSRVITRMVGEIFDPRVVTCFEGGPIVAQQLLALPFDHIFFTGSPAIGKVVMKAAAENLCSVTLELGGKCPAIVTDSAHLKDAAQRIAFTKFVNNGQTCIAPDYVLVDKKIEQDFIRELKANITALFTEGNASFEKSEHYCRIVNEKHFARLNDLLGEAVAKGATLAFGGTVNAATRFIAPVLLTDVPADSRIMEEEIFGPLLPIMTYSDLDQALNIVNGKSKPLALYVFSNKKAITEKVLLQTTAGGVCINDCAIHFFHPGLPFGGVNTSGIGKSHGHFGFVSFSNEKPVLRQRRGMTSVQLFLPPYTRRAKRIMEWFLKLF